MHRIASNMIDDGVKLGGKIVSDIGVAQWNLERFAPLPVSTGNVTIAIKTCVVLDQNEMQMQRNECVLHKDSH